MRADFTDRVVLVTGASKGIGAATAVAFGAAGARVVVNYRSDPQGAEATVGLIVDAGGMARAVRADVGSPTDIEDLVVDIERHEGKIDVLVNNAAGFSRTSFLDADLADLDQVWATNVRGVFHLSQAVARGMAGNGGGSIVHISSILARLAVANRTIYCATKGAIESLTRAMALDLAPLGIRVNAVAPGLISTEALLAGMPDPAVQAAIRSFIPGGRFGEPEEIAAVVVWVASDEARYVNGTIIAVDAGLGGKEAGPAPRASS